MDKNCETAVKPRQTQKVSVFSSLKETFCRNALMLPRIGWRERMLLSLILLFDFWYVLANSQKAFAGIEIVSLRTLHMISFGGSALAFVYILRQHMMRTLDFSIGRLEAVAYAGAAYLSSFMVYWAYNTAMTFFRTPLGGDVQHIGQTAKIGWDAYSLLVVRYIVTLANEELMIFAAFLLVFSFMKQSAKSAFASCVIAVLLFSMLHAPSWNIATVPAVMANKLPAALMLVLFMDLKPLYLAHLFNNCYVSLSMVQGMTGNFRSWTFAIFLMPLVFWLAKHTTSDIVGKPTS